MLLDCLKYFQYRVSDVGKSDSPTPTVECSEIQQYYHHLDHCKGCVDPRKDIIILPFCF